METIRVNMTPCEDIKTIHASQNDNEAREWGFELHNNGEKIDSSSISDQLVFKAYEGGTEQILPTNGSTPTTSPFKGDIKYPQGLLSDQEFLYRQSPTEEDGLAKITDIKGNTLVWNQLVENGNFALASGWTAASIDFNITIGNDMATLEVVTPKDSAILQGNVLGTKQDHFYYAVADFKYDVAPGSSEMKRIFIGSGGYDGILKNVTQSNTWVTVSGFFKRNTGGNDTFRIYPRTGGMSVGDKIYVRNAMIVDLTALFGVDKALELWHMENTAEGSGVAYFSSLYPLPYYEYNAGTLLSFNGTGLKTTGKNQVTNIVRGYFSVGASAISVDNDSESFVFYAIKGKTYVSSSAVNLNRNAIARCDTPNLVNGSPIYDIVNTSRTWTATWTGWAVWYVYSSKNEVVENSAQVEFGTTATSYEPYTSSTLSLPISTYFTNGMKSAGNVYDELTETSKTIRTKYTLVDGTNVVASYYGVFGGHQLFYVNVLDSQVLAPLSNQGNITTNHYLPSRTTNMDDRYARYRVVSNQVDISRVYWNDDRYTSAEEMNTALQSSPLEIVSLAQSETVETFSVASLVTENAEIPLSNEDGVLVGKCTEELSAEPGFHDAKIKLADADGECYSNKLQLHVERSPQ